MSGGREAELSRRTLRGFFWTGSAQVAQAALQLGVMIALARLVTPAEFGVVGAALVVVGLAQATYQMGLGPALVQRPDLEPRHVQTAFVASIVFGVALGASMWAAAPAVADFFRIDGVESVVRAFAWLIPLVSLGRVAEAQLTRDLRFRWLASRHVITYGIGYGAVGITLAALDAGVWALVGATFAQALLNTALLLIACPPPRALRPQWRAFRELLYFGGGHTLGRLGKYLAHHADNIVVGRWLGAEALGLYGRAYHLMTLPSTFVGNLLDRVLFPVMARLQDDPQRLSAAYTRAVAVVALVLLPGSTVLSVLAPELIALLFGPQWAEMVATWRILALGITLRTSYMISDSLVRATGAVYARAWRQFAFATLVVAAAALGQRWGIEGVAACVLAALVVNFAGMAHLGMAVSGTSWRRFWHAHVPAVALAAVTTGVAWPLASWLRLQGTSPVLTVLATSAAALATAVVVMASSPSRFLGPEGLRTLEMLRGSVPRRALQTP